MASQRPPSPSGGEPFQAELTFLHRNATCRECFDAALHIAKKTPGTSVVSACENGAVLQKTTQIQPHIGGVLKLPPSLTYCEKWVFEGKGVDERCLVTAAVESGAYALRIGSQYRSTRGEGGALDTSVRTKVRVSGLGDNTAMLALFKAYAAMEFSAQRSRESRRIARARRRADDARAGSGFVPQGVALAVAAKHS